MSLDDADIRQMALDPRRSFIVRAPAGSGKTTVLIRRLLCLLGLVENPEEIVAVTFTRKAAQEMRDRVTDALLIAKAGVAPTEEFNQKTYELALVALDNDQRRGWDLIYHPSRLRILTIDALCQSIVRQMPMMSGMAGLATIEDTSMRLRLYKQAARSACEEIVDDEMNSVVAKALKHFDNDWAKLEGLIAEMLPKRDQWLHFIGKKQDRSAFRAAYTQLVNSKLSKISGQLDNTTRLEIMNLVKYAASNLESSPLSQITQFPTDIAEDLCFWQSMLDLFLTKTGTFRKSANVKIGFPLKHPFGAEEMKRRWKEIVKLLSERTTLLNEILVLPLDAYIDEEWEITEALVKLLRLSAAHLMVLSDRVGRTDFTAFSMAALDALGNADDPTDLALGLDYQINHLLVDEFQDTSVTQFELVSRLIAGWAEGDQKSIFLVGDPMQSIYRFRQSEVSLFKRVRDAGFVGNIKVDSLSLSVNFRSQCLLVDWVNTTIPQVIGLSGRNDDFFGVQKASRSEAGEPFAFYPFSSKSSESEAEQVIKIIVDIREKTPEDSIAILVRSRAHLNQITARLIEVNINVSARELEKLESRPVIKDLMSLSNALNHLGDRMAWLAVLRAPWGGLSLSTLHQLSELSPTFLGALHLAAERKLVSGKQGERVARLSNVLHLAVGEIAEVSFSQAVQKCWLALGGPAVFHSEQSFADATQFFAIMTRLEGERAFYTAERLRAAIGDYYSEGRARTYSSAIEIMTMHQAKGLEFDHVIIPSLGLGVKSGAKPLLHWQQNYDDSNLSSLLIAPVGAPNTDKALYDYLHYSDSQENKAEMVRLLYVVLTRARTKVHLLGHANEDKKKKAWKPQAGSLLALLWPVVSQFFEKLQEDLQSSRPASTEQKYKEGGLQVVRALPASLPEHGRYYKKVTMHLTDRLAFDWAGNVARHVGTVVHRLLELVSKNMLNGSFAEMSEPVKYFASNQLKSLGVANSDLQLAVKSVLRAMEKSLSSDRGSWLFSEVHSMAESELALSCEMEDGSLENIVIDRTFVDKKGIRWIVDYKTGWHSGSGLNEYLDSEEQRYKLKLNHYAKVVSSLHSEPIKLGLYFPLIDAWRQWDYTS